MSTPLDGGYQLVVRNTFIDVPQKSTDGELDGSAQSTFDALKEIVEESPSTSLLSDQDSTEELSFEDDADAWRRIVTGAPLDSEEKEDWTNEKAHGEALDACAGNWAWTGTETTSPVLFDCPVLPCIVVDDRYESASSGIPLAWANVCTAMMRNLPNNYSQKLLVEELQSAGFAGLYDFLYLPMDKETKANKGYAFINFIAPCYTWGFKIHYEGKRMPGFNSGKLVSISKAALQGLAANVAHYSSSRVSRGDPDARPLFFNDVSAAVNKRVLAKGTSACSASCINDTCDGWDAAAQSGVVPNGRRRRRRGGRCSLIDIALRTKQKTESHEQTQQQLLERQHVKVSKCQRHTDSQYLATEAKSTACAATNAGAPFGFCCVCGFKKGNGWKFCQSCGACFTLYEMT
jgi:hypothetical protein